MENEHDKLFVEERTLVKRWKGPIPVLVNLAFMLAIFYATWWIFQDPRGLMRLYTPYKGYMVCRWLLIMFIWVAYIFNFWPFKRTWLEKTHPLLKGLVLTGFSVGVMWLVIQGFFVHILGNFGIAYFNPERLAALGLTEFYAEEYAYEAIMMFAAIASWLSPSWVVACENAPWEKEKQPVRGVTVLIVTFFISMISHMAILYYPWQEFTAITPPYWEKFANTVSGNFHIAWIMSATVVVWLYETIWERYPFDLIKKNWLRRVSSFFGIWLIAVALSLFLYFAQELGWGPAIRGSRRLMAPDWRWLHVGEMAIFWLVPSLFLYFFLDNWPKSYSRPVNIFIRTVVTVIGAALLYIVYYKTSHLFLGTQKGFSHPQQFPMIPMIWLINVFLVNYWFMDGWPGWKLAPSKAVKPARETVAVVKDEVRWTPKFVRGLALGTVAGVILYLGIIKFIPWWCDVYTIIQ
jgi:amino acid transporter, AAT family